MKLLLSTLDMILLVDSGFVFQPKKFSSIKVFISNLTVFVSSKVFFALIVLLSLCGWTVIVSLDTNLAFVEFIFFHCPRIRPISIFNSKFFFAGKFRRWHVTVWQKAAASFLAQFWFKKSFSYYQLW